MNSLNVKRFGFAVGATFGLVYLGCVLVLFVAGRDTAVLFANSLLHGLDVSGIVRMNVPLWEAVIGLVETFIIAWLAGACVAAIYNATVRTRT